MRYIDQAHPAYSRACEIMTANADGTATIRVFEADGSSNIVERALVVPVGGTPPPGDFYAQVEKTASELQAEQAAAANGATLRQNIANVQAAHRAYIALASPTAAQRKAWEDNVARNLLALNRFLLNDLTGTS